MSKLSLFDMCIVGKYLNTKHDFENLVRVNSKFKYIVDSYHFNPISDTTLFNNMQTQYVYTHDDKLLYGMKQVFWNEINYDRVRKYGTYKNVVVTYSSANKYLRQECTNTKITIKKFSDGCFTCNYSITNVTLPSGVIILCERCFSYCKNLETVVLPDGIRYIGKYCFEYCKRLKKVNLQTG